jgi:hypothetical protein
MFPQCLGDRPVEGEHVVEADDLQDVADLRRGAARASSRPRARLAAPTSTPSPVESMDGQPLISTTRRVKPLSRQASSCSLRSGAVKTSSSPSTRMTTVSLPSAS